MSEESFPEAGVAQYTYQYPYDAAGHLDWALAEPAIDAGIAPERGICDDCKGTGKIALLISVRPCAACGGTGHAPAASPDVGAPGYAYAAADRDADPPGADDGVRGRAYRLCYHYDASGRIVASDVVPMD